MDVRSSVRTLVRPVYHWVLDPLPVDPTRRWQGNAEDGAPLVRVAFYGDCSLRAMDRSHGVHTPVGWPGVLADRLLERGVRMEFSAVFAPLFENLPGRDGLDQFLRLTGAPDVVFVQIGAQYARRTVLPDSPMFLRLREDIGRRAGRHVFAGYGVVRPVTRVLGRQRVPYAGAGGLDRFFAAGRDAWPHAVIALIVPPPRLRAAKAQRAIEARVASDARAACDRARVECLDLTAVRPGEQALRCANGYNLSTAGAQLAGDQLAEWLFTRRNVPA
jgi:hypothetical protein